MTKAEEKRKMFSLEITISSDKEDFSEEKMFTVIADGLRGYDTEAIILGAPTIDARQEAIGFTEWALRNYEGRIINDELIWNKKLHWRVTLKGITTEQLYDLYLKSKV